MHQLPGQDAAERADRTSGERRQVARTGVESLADLVRKYAADLRAAQSWAELHARLAAIGLVLESGSNPYNRQTDSLCVAAMSIASPTSSFWTSLLPPHYLQHVVQSGDIVADEPTNTWPRTVTDSSLFYNKLAYEFPITNPLQYNPVMGGFSCISSKRI